MANFYRWKDHKPVNLDCISTFYLVERDAPKSKLLLLLFLVDSGPAVEWQFDTKSELYLSYKALLDHLSKTNQLVQE